MHEDPHIIYGRCNCVCSDCYSGKPEDEENDGCICEECSC